ncbi:MAG: hypothetical protein IBX62_09885 [Coriobacteriia bacterium]|nr:hypothetical protein [Coriobacteriia bacterium]
MGDPRPVADDAAEAPSVVEGSSAPAHGRRARLAILLVAVATVLLTYAYTLNVRIPLLDRPASWTRHAEGAARTLRHMRIWDEVGLLETRFMMRTTDVHPGDRYIRDVGYLPDDEGVYYYVSFPPLFPLLPFLLLKAVNAPLGILSLRIFALGLHLVTAMLLFMLTRRVLLSRGEAHASSAGAFAAAVMLVSPGPLWYFSNAYESAALETPLLIACTYLGVRLLTDELRPRWLVPAFAAASFALAYTEWLGIMFAASVGVVALLRRDRRSLLAFAVSAAAVAAALGLMTLQYSSVAGFKAFVEAIRGKAEMRVTFGGAVHHSLTSWPSWSHLLKWVKQGYGPGLVALAALAASWLVGMTSTPGGFRRRLRATFPRPLGVALALTALPAALHLLALFSHTVIHDFGLLKWAVPLGLLVGALAAELGSWGARSRNRLGALAAAALVLAVAVHTVLPEAIKRDFTVTWGAVKVGTAIAQTGVDPDEPVFVEAPRKFYMGSSTVYYAGRNLARYKDAAGAAAIMKRSGATGAVLFRVNEDMEVERTERLGPDGHAIGSAQLE